MAEKAGKNKLIIILIAVIVLLVIAGAAVWWFMMRSTSAPTPAQVAQQQAQQKLKNTKFIDLGSLVTNLQSADGNTHYIQVQVQLKTYDPTVEASVKSYMPEIRNGILLLLSAQNADTVSQPAVRDQLLQKIKEQVNKVLETDGGALAKPAPEKTPPIAAVYFASFVVQ
ncbi:flagellar basal body-associated FliL family protein [Acidithiobacillus thiooxidans]|uniref:Flagellar protein FliL n=1 Tax=Acidithiobacillus thiooxidans ATCC 19377 TaxID=637390 RepID=A0A543Q7X9_ACITH|nr:flagellar basal body-associated FliL family protein [Acidithiobacillus thiooxidans]MDX5936074.1 flagellar basal body-associated FliL family protein [Acidithiobacillus thiooxidans]TQN52420.1 Flagellar protein FliL [Acidithiobacillus thiooxidans ATCC 19377]